VSSPDGSLDLPSAGVWSRLPSASEEYVGKQNAVAVVCGAESFAVEVSQRDRAGYESFVQSLVQLSQLAFSGPTRSVTTYSYVALGEVTITCATGSAPIPRWQTHMFRVWDGEKKVKFINFIVVLALLIDLHSHSLHPLWPSEMGAGGRGAGTTPETGVAPRRRPFGAFRAGGEPVGRGGAAGQIRAVAAGKRRPLSNGLPSGSTVCCRARRLPSIPHATHRCCSRIHAVSPASRSCKASSRVA
jgi:hypothetical protein